MDDNSIYAKIYSEQYLNRQNILLVNFVNKTSLPSKHVLDIGCGSGYQAAALASNKYKVIGIDSDRYMIETARKLHDNTNLDFFQGDLLNFTSTKNFGFIYSLFNVFNYFESELYLEKTIQKIKNITGKGSIIIIEMWNGELAQANPPKNVTTKISTTAFGNLEVTYNPVRLARDEYFMSTNITNTEAIFPNGKKSIAISFKHKLWTIEQISYLFSKNHFTLIGIADQKDWVFHDSCASWKVALCFQKEDD